MVLALHIYINGAAGFAATKSVIEHTAGNDPHEKCFCSQAQQKYVFSHFNDLQWNNTKLAKEYAANNKVEAGVAEHKTICMMKLPVARAELLVRV